jgi:tetratricopeptide (TPR) repeat protein
MHLLLLGQSSVDNVPGVLPEHTLRLDAVTLPFLRPEEISLPAPPRVLFVQAIERSFPNYQTSGTRLVLTQSTYLVQKWIDVLGGGGRIIATADRIVLEQVAPEALQARGPWVVFSVAEGARDATTEVTEAPTEVTGSVSSVGSSVPSVVKLLSRAYNSPSPDERLQLCRDATIAAPDSAVAALALASACRELQDLTGARDALEEAARLAPAWEAVHYEFGKFWLGYDDMERARTSFERACDLMPTFSAAFSNLGAILGELDQPEAALEAFTHALAHDPNGYTILNNIGVGNRELGRLDESEAAFRRVIAIAPDFVFGHYNLGHTLFLRGRFREALAAYEEGQRLDLEKNRRQGCRLAVVRFANGDRAGADRDLWHFANQAPADEREDLLLEAYEIVRALLVQRPDLDPAETFLEQIGREIT